MLFTKSDKLWMAREAFFLYKLLFKHVTSYQKKPEKFKT